MPNLVHSLDAASLALLVDYFFMENKKINRHNFYSIHDCFAVTCNNVTHLYDLLKTIYINIYTKDSYLLQLNQGILDNIIKHLGSDCYDSEKNLIYYLDQNQIKKQIEFPDVKKLVSTDILNLNKSSYLIH